jgi:hypothetical protein
MPISANTQAATTKRRRRYEKVAICRSIRAGYAEYFAASRRVRELSFKTRLLAGHHDVQHHDVQHHVDDDPADDHNVQDDHVDDDPADHDDVEQHEHDCSDDHVDQHNHRADEHDVDDPAVYHDNYGLDDDHRAVRYDDGGWSVQAGMGLRRREPLPLGTPKPVR